MFFGERSGDQRPVSSNVFANGSNQNAGNQISDRSTTRIHQQPGGRSEMGSILAWGGDEPQRHSRGQQVTLKPGQGGPSSSQSRQFGADSYEPPSPYGGQGGRAPPSAPGSFPSRQFAADSYEPPSPYGGKGGGSAPPFNDQSSRMGASHREGPAYDGRGANQRDGPGYDGRGAPVQGRDFTAEAEAEFYGAPFPGRGTNQREGPGYDGRGAPLQGRDFDAPPFEERGYGGSPNEGRFAGSQQSHPQASQYEQHGGRQQGRQQYPGRESEPPFAHSHASQFEEGFNETAQPRGKGRARPPPTPLVDTTPFGTDHQPATPSLFRGEREATPFGTDNAYNEFRRPPAPTYGNSPQQGQQGQHGHPDEGRDCRAANESHASRAMAQSSNGYASGQNQNCGNKITDRRMTRINAPPGGHSSFTFG